MSSTRISYASSTPTHREQTHTSQRSKTPLNKGSKKEGRQHKNVTRTIYQTDDDQILLMSFMVYQINAGIQKHLEFEAGEGYW